METLKIALRKHKIKSSILLHSDQDAQFTSKDFTDFRKTNKVIQSMSKAGCPYDNAPMQRFYNTLKNEYINRKRLISKCPKIKIVQLELEHFTLVVRFFIYSYFESLMPKALDPPALLDDFCNRHQAYIVINIGDTDRH